MKRANGVVVCGDSLAVATAVATASVDAIYIDPPFGTGMVQKGQAGRYRDRQDQPHEFVAWLSPWLRESHRVLTATGSLLVHLDYRSVHYVKVALDEIFGRPQFVNEIVWCYSVGGKSRRGFGRKHDTILWYGRSADYWFDPSPVRVPRRGGSHMRMRVDADGRPFQEKTDKRSGRVYRYAIADGKIPEDWWSDIETLNQSDRERVRWPSQKPERLLHRLLAGVVRPGNLVVDWFAGSGTTASVASQLGCRYLAVDAEPAACALASVRLGVPITPVAAFTGRQTDGRQLNLFGAHPLRAEEGTGENR